MQINFGTQWDVASIGCAGCIKINFADGVVYFWHFIMVRFWFIKKKSGMVFETFEVELEQLRKF